MIFRETGGDYDLDFHNAPRRQYVVMLEGAVEIEIGDGTKRVLGTGEILLAEDTTGQGHISRAVNGQPRKVAVYSVGLNAVVLGDAARIVLR